MKLNERIEAAIKRVVEGKACMRVPAEETDPDLVLRDALKEIERLENEEVLATAQRKQEVFELTRAAERSHQLAQAVIAAFVCDGERGLWKSLEEDRDNLRARVIEARKALRNFQCGCTLSERLSGHRVDCGYPDLESALYGEDKY